MAFSVGDKVVYPGIGAGRIVNAEERHIMDRLAQYFVIEVPGKASTLYVPTEKMEELRVRPAMPRRELAQVFETLASDPEPLPKQHDVRQGQIEEKLKAGEPIPIAEAVRDLSWHRHVAHLTDRDSALLTQCRNLLAEEVAIVTDAEVADVHETIDEAVAVALAKEPDPDPAQETQAPTSAQPSPEQDAQRTLLGSLRLRVAKVLGMGTK